MCVGGVRVWRTSILVHVVCLVSVVSVCAGVGVVCGRTGVYVWGVWCGCIYDIRVCVYDVSVEVWVCTWVWYGYVRYLDVCGVWCVSSV